MAHPLLFSVTGVRQGCSLNTILFNLFLNDITKLFSDINGFETGSKKINYLPYADDLLLLCKCRSDLQLCLSRLHKCTIKWGLKINIKNLNSLFLVNIEEEITNFTSMGSNWNRLVNIHISVSYFIELAA